MKMKWITPEQISDDLCIPLEDVDTMIDDRELRAIELPSGVRRVDPRSYRAFLYARRLGARPCFAPAGREDDNE
jgi:hypothetical protein